MKMTEEQLAAWRAYRKEKRTEQAVSFFRRHSWEGREPRPVTVSLNTGVAIWTKRW